MINAHELDELADDRIEGPGLSHSELAEIFGISRARVGQLEARALKKIRAAAEREAAKAGFSNAMEWLWPASY